MKVAFSQISAGGTYYPIRESGWFPVDEFVLRQFQDAEIDLLKKDNETVLLEGKIQAILEIICDRCGEPFDYNLSCDFYYVFKIGEDSSKHVLEMECSGEDFNTVYLDEPIIDILEVLREQVLLATPDWKICGKDCKGVCPGCGAALKYEACRCESVPSNTPFAVLEKLKKH